MEGDGKAVEALNGSLPLISHAIHGPERQSCRHNQPIQLLCSLYFARCRFLLFLEQRTTPYSTCFSLTLHTLRTSIHTAPEPPKGSF